MKIHLDDDLKAFIKGEVEAGRFDSEDAAINAAVRELRREQEDRAALRKEIQIGIDAADREDFVELSREDLKAWMREQARG